jgi:Asp-tRNA(Asn)/Glu-tRNA(Gln) amidotransferase A subunit family amidase
MVSTSNRLRKKFGDEKVNRVLSRLSQRRYRGNQYQKQESDEITRFIDKLFKNYDLI